MLSPNWIELQRAYWKMAGPAGQRRQCGVPERVPKFHARSIYLV
jgi:hypothetical protein